MEDDVMYLFLINTKVWKYSRYNGFELVMILNNCEILVNPPFVFLWRRLRGKNQIKFEFL